MDIALHLGAHLTDEGQFRNCLRANQDSLSRAGIVVPRPRDCLALVVEAANQVSEGEEAPDFMPSLCSAVGADEGTRRLVLAAPGLLARLPEVLDGRVLYPQAGPRLQALRKLFEGQSVEIFFCIRNPATYVPAFLANAKAKHAAKVQQNLAGEALRWSQLVTDFRMFWPEARLTLWCDEDTPFLWHQLLEKVAGVAPEGGFAGSYQWFDSVMVDGGAEKLEAYLAASPPVDEEHRQKVIAAFLDKFCDDAKLDVDISATGWDEAQLDVLTQLYEDDVAQIARMEGVQVLQP